MLIYFEREKESTCTSEEGQREGKRIPSRCCTISIEPGVGPELTNHEIVT